MNGNTVNIVFENEDIQFLVSWWWPCSRCLSQVKSLMARAEELQRKLEEAGESNRIITQAVRLKQDEVDQLTVMNSAVNRKLKARCWTEWPIWLVYLLVCAWGRGG